MEWELQREKGRKPAQPSHKGGCEALLLKHSQGVYSATSAWRRDKGTVRGSVHLGYKAFLPAKFRRLNAFWLSLGRGRDYRGDARSDKLNSGIGILMEVPDLVTLTPLMGMEVQIRLVPATEDPGLLLAEKITKFF
jgi:hypothetical protein